MNETKKNKPMPAAKIKYDPEGNILWDKMWDSFCDLAAEGGPPHRGVGSSIKEKDISKKNDKNSKPIKELIRGLKLLTKRQIKTDKDGWVSIKFENKNVAKWFSKVISYENVVAKYDKNWLLLPCSESFTIESEVKSVLTVFGKANHYWTEHRSFAEKVLVFFFGYDVRIG